MAIASTVVLCIIFLTVLAYHILGRHEWSTYYGRIDTDTTECMVPYWMPYEEYYLVHTSIGDSIKVGSAWVHIGDTVRTYYCCPWKGGFYHKVFRDSTGTMYSVEFDPRGNTYAQPVAIPVGQNNNEQSE